MAETTNYLLLGLGVSLGIMSLYAVSLWLRLQNALKDEATVDRLMEE